MIPKLCNPLLRCPHAGPNHRVNLNLPSRLLLLGQQCPLIWSQFKYDSLSLLSITSYETVHTLNIWNIWRHNKAKTNYCINNLSINKLVKFQRINLVSTIPSMNQTKVLHVVLTNLQYLRRNPFLRLMACHNQQLLLLTKLRESWIDSIKAMKESWGFIFPLTLSKSFCTNVQRWFTLKTFVSLSPWTWGVKSQNLIGNTEQFNTRFIH